MSKSPNKITARERDIIELIDQEDLTNQEIADRLFLAKSTVSWYVKHLNQKLYTSSRYEIVEEARRLGILADDAQIAPSLGLPRQTTPFVGRDAELDMLHILLDKPDMRLMTILAPGGMGKTRLAIEAAEQQSDHYPDGVYFVPLRPLNDPEHIVGQIATHCGYPMSNDGRSPKQQVLDYLANKRLLIVIDNFEHLLEAAPLLNEILTTAPDVKLIVTSREKLNLTGETVYSLTGMEFPSWERPEDALEYDAVQLLVNAASRVKPDWTVTADNLDYVAQVCKLTAGMPLGILLAASWLDVFSLETICDEIQNSADILETEMRDVPPRQRSIRAVFESTWERLKPDERDVLMRMSVFLGGCTPEAAKAVAGANPRRLQALVNKALLMREANNRYDLHELLRQYAEQYLDESGNGDSVRDRHMEYYSELCISYGEKLIGAEQVVALDTIEQDFDNIHNAWERAHAKQAWVRLTEMVEPLRMFALIRIPTISLMEMYYSVYRDLCANESDDADLLTLKYTLEVRGAHHINYVTTNDLQDLEVMVKRAVSAARERNDEESLSLSLASLSMVLHKKQRVREARILAQQAYNVAQQAGHLPEIVRTSRYVALLAWINGDISEALTHYKIMLDVVEDLANPFGIGLGSFEVANVYYALGNYGEALQALERGRAHLERVGATSYFRSMAIFSQCRFSLDLLDLETAQIHLAELSTIADGLKAPQALTQLSYLRAGMSFLKQDYEIAQRQLIDALSFADGLPMYHLIVLISTRMCAALAMQGVYDEAIEQLVRTQNLEVDTIVIQQELELLFALIRIFDHYGEDLRCLELLSLFLNHPKNFPYNTQHPYILRLHEHLQQEVPTEDYAAIWEHGQSLDLAETVQALVDELSQTTGA